MRRGDARGAAGQDARRARAEGKGFAPVLARVDTLALANLARELLEQRHRRGPGRGADPVPLPVVGDPFFGSGHVFYVIRFPHDDGRGGTRDGGEETDRDGDGDGVQWIAKIPAAAEDGAWDQLCCEALRAEAFLLHMLREETGVPVAEVVDADCRPGNGVGAPWLLMEFVEGWRLEDVWFGGDGGGGDVNVDVDGRARRERREKILRNVAGVVLELGRYEFESGGALVFDRRRSWRPRRHHGSPARTGCESHGRALVRRRRLPVYAAVSPYGALGSSPRHVHRLAGCLAAGYGVRKGRR